MTTKVQHFVWRNYLKRWTNENSSNGKIFVYRKKTIGTQPQFPDNPVLLTNVGFGKYYYDVTGFSQKDVVLLEKLIEHMEKKSPVKMHLNFDVLPEARDNRDFIENILGQYENIDNRHGFIDYIVNNNLSFYRDGIAQTTLNELLDEIQYRIFFGEESQPDEELYAKFLKAMENVTAEDVKHEFHRFFFMQYFRAPVIIDAQRKSFDDLKRTYPDKIGDIDTDFYVKMSMIFLTEKVALNISHNFHTWIERLENITDIPFVTSDTPVINLTGTEFLDKNEFYFPVSPYVAMKLCITRKNGSYGKVDNKNFIVDDSDKIRRLNMEIVKHCQNEIFADRRNILEQIVNEI